MRKTNLEQRKLRHYIENSRTMRRGFERLCLIMNTPIDKVVLNA